MDEKNKLVGNTAKMLVSEYTYLQARFHRSVSTRGKANQEPEQPSQTQLQSHSFPLLWCL